MTDDIIPISIWLRKHTSRIMYCMMCKTNLGFAVEGVPAEIIEGSDANADNAQNIKFPIKARCHGRGSYNGIPWRCPAMYIIQGIIDK